MVYGWWEEVTTDRRNATTEERRCNCLDVGCHMTKGEQSKIVKESGEVLRPKC